MSKIKYFLLNILMIFSFNLLFISCTTDPVAPGTTTSLEFSNMQVLPPGYCYRLWFSYPKESAKIKQPNPGNSFNKSSHGVGEFMSICRFTLDSSNKITFLDGKTNADVPAGINPNLFVEVVISIEAINDLQLKVPLVKYISGYFTGDDKKGTANLDLFFTESFGSQLKYDISNFSFFFLDTPTTKDLNDFESGIWFAIQHGSDSLISGLSLKSPQSYSAENTRWIFESWLVRKSDTGSQYISLGKFKDITSADQTKAGDFAGDILPYNFPGEDFVKPAGKRILTDGTYNVVVSLQPFDFDFRFPFIPIQKTLEPIPKNVSRLSQLRLLADIEKLPKATIKINRWAVN